jgi:hypothetical protein
MTTASVDSEISQLEHELEILRSRYALMERGRRALKIFFVVMLPPLAIVIAGVAVYALVTDIVVGLYIVGITVAAAVLVWIGRDTKEPSAAVKRPLRWIDKVSLPGFSDGFHFHQQLSDAQVIEEMIALREKRLGELKRTQP